MKRSFLTVLMVSSALSFNALADVPSCGENCTYEMSANGTDSNGNTTYTLVVKPVDNTLPANIQYYSRYGYPQTGTNYAPWRFDNVTEVVVESGIENISYGAFSDQSIKKVTLSEGLKTLGSLAFHGTSITEIELPDTLTTIGEWGLACPLLEKLEIPSGVESIGRYGLAGIQVSDLVIPLNVKVISSEAFGTYTNLNKVYCEEMIANQCSEAINNTNKDVALIRYQTEDGLYVLTDEHGNKSYFISAADLQTNQNFCSVSNVDECKKTLLFNKGLCADLNGDCRDFVAADNAGRMLKVGSKTYQSLDALLKGDFDRRRIYTVDEANFVAGKKNSIKIRYK